MPDEGVLSQVMAQGLLTQLWGPLQFLGWFYRELRQSLVDVDAFFQILQTTPGLPEGPKRLPATSSLGTSSSSLVHRSLRSIASQPPLAHLGAASN